MFRALLAIALLWYAPASAVDLFVATTGTDAGNNCQTLATPCNTGQYAVDQIPVGTGAGYDIYFADGIYYGEINVTYWRIINVFGNCANLTSVMFRPSDNYTTLISAQDGAIVGVNCLSLDGAGLAGTNGLFSHQHAIIDFRWLQFWAMGGEHIVVDHATLSCTGPYYIMGGAVVHASSYYQGSLRLPCSITLIAPLSFQIFIQAGFQSVVSLVGATIGGPGAGTATSGQQFTSQDGSCVSCAMAPGNIPGALFGSGTAP
jgi:hypothetical protein